MLVHNAIEVFVLDQNSTYAEEGFEPSNGGEVFGVGVAAASTDHERV